MHAKVKALVSNDEPASLRLAVVALLIGLLALALETVLNVSLKLPGHRALPGALALLVFAEAFAPIVLLAFAATISTILILAGGQPTLVWVVWGLSALGIAALSRSPLAHKVVTFLLGGLLFGLLRYLCLPSGMHHTPELIRIAGHLGFGALGGAMALVLVRGLSQPKER
ncbi:MAG: hypothetical protein MUC50_12140 [Myxococcota bacterium]|nr:hypothetical protein [Myxococcota bacterium]